MSSLGHNGLSYEFLRRPHIEMLGNKQDWSMLVSTQHNLFCPITRLENYWEFSNDIEVPLAIKDHISTLADGDVSPLPLE